MINIKFPLQPHLKYDITQYEELVFSLLTQMKDDYANSSHYLTYKFLLKRLRRMYFMNLGVKGLKHFTTLLGAKAFNLFSPKFKKYILPTFSREMYK